MRRQINKSVDTNIFERLSHKRFRNNAISPEIVRSPTWFFEDPALEVIELNSSNKMEELPRDIGDNMHHFFGSSYKDNIQQINDNYRINEKVKEKRCIQRPNNINTSPYIYTSNSNDCIDLPKHFYTNDFVNDTDNELKNRNQINCFAIINKHYIDSDTPADGDYSNVEIINSNDIIFDYERYPTSRYNESNIFNKETISHDSIKHQKSQSVCIYSYKNKHLLSDEDFAVSISNNDISSSPTTSDSDISGDVRNKCSSTYHFGSRMLHIYIPRLDLSLGPTMSTVTEISDNIQVSPKNSKRFPIRDMNRSDSILYESPKLDYKKSGNKHPKSTNIINWMALSPRQAHRVLNHRDPSDMWLGSPLNLAQVNLDNNGENHSDQTNKIIQIHKDSLKIQVDVDVHVDTNRNNEKIDTKLNSANAAQFCKGLNSTNKLAYAETYQKGWYSDRDDYIKIIVVPAVHLTPNLPKSTKISDPIEKLENNNWIREVRDEKEIAVYDYTLEKSESSLNDENNVNECIRMKDSVSTLKSAEKNEYVPTAESPISYHLSFGSIVEERKSWLKRFIRFFKCCK